MTRDQLEFLISQYLDGTIRLPDRVALEERLAADPEAQQVLDEYRRLNVVARSALPLPALDWQTLSQRISANITDEAVAHAQSISTEAPDAHPGLSSINEEYEFAIAQYADGTLPHDQQQAFERRLAADPAARAMLEEYRSLDAMARVADPLPQVNWDLLHQRIAAAIEDQEAPATYSRSLKWLRSAPILAMAASIILLLSVTITLIMNREGTGNGGRALGPAVAEVTGPAIERPQGTSLALVELVEPTSGMAGSFPGASDVVNLPSRIELARAYRVQPQPRDESPF